MEQANCKAILCHWLTYSRLAALLKRPTTQAMHSRTQQLSLVTISALTGSSFIELYFHTFTMPSLEAVTIKPCVVWKVAMSVIMSWCPAGSDSGPLRGASSLGPTVCLLWISYKLKWTSIKLDVEGNICKTFCKSVNLENIISKCYRLRD